MRRCWMLIRLEYIPVRSPTSFSYEGGVVKESCLISSTSLWTLDERPADLSFARSLRAFLDRRTVYITT